MKPKVLTLIAMALAVAFMFGRMTAPEFEAAAQAQPQSQAAPFCAGARGDQYAACATIRNWCAWVSQWGTQVSDTQIRNLFENMRRSCPRRWRR